MPFPSIQLFALVALGGASIRGFDSVSLTFPADPPKPPEGSVLEYSASQRGLAPAWLHHIPKYVCDHAEVSVELSEPSKFGPRWLSVGVANFAGGPAEGTCLIDTRRGPKIVRYALTPTATERSDP